MRRKGIFLLLALVLVLAGLPVSPASGDSDDITVDYTVSDSSIIRGEVFELRVTASSSSITSGTISYITDDNFTVINTEASSNIFENPTVYTMKYNGGSNAAAFKISYNQSGAKSVVKVINISEVDEDSGSSSSGSSAREPKLDIENTSIPSAKAGDSIKLPLTITNNSSYAARNISVKLSLEDDDQNPFEVDSLNLTQSITTLNPQKSEGVIFNLKINPYAAEKTYSLNVNLKYSDRSGNSYSSSDQIYIRVQNSSVDPTLVVQGLKCDPGSVQAGDNVNISFTLLNIGDMTAKGIKLSLDGLKKEEFTLLDGTDTSYIDGIDGKQSINMKYTLAASDAMESGNYSLGIKLDYKDARNNKYSDEQRIFINVKGKAKSSNVVIENIATAPQEVRANESFTLSFNVRNDGKSRAGNIKISVKGDEGIFSKSPDVKIIEGLEPGQSQEAQFVMFAGDQLKSKNYNIQISLEYEDPQKDNAKYTVSQYAGIYVNGANSKLTPKIIINKYAFEPVIVRAGEEFNLDMSFLNTSSDRTIRNIKIFLTGIDADKEGKVVFTPVNSSNTFYIDAIAPKGTSKKSMTMYTIPDAEPRTYTVTANFEYQDEEGTEYKATELIGIPVIQQSKLDAGEISIPPQAFVGQPIPVNIQYFNKGKTKLSNLIITVEGDFDIQNKQSYIGNIDSGSSDYFEANITPTKTGNLGGRLIFTFDDPSGQSQQLVREFTVNAMEMPPMNPADQMPPEGMDKGKNFMAAAIKNKFFWIGLAAALVAAIATVRFLKARKRKGIEFDE